MSFSIRNPKADTSVLGRYKVVVLHGYSPIEFSTSDGTNVYTFLTSYKKNNATSSSDPRILYLPANSIMTKMVTDNGGDLITTGGSPSIEVGRLTSYNVMPAGNLTFTVGQVNAGAYDMTSSPISPTPTVFTCRTTGGSLTSGSVKISLEVCVPL